MSDVPLYADLRRLVQGLRSRAYIRLFERADLKHGHLIFVKNGGRSLGLTSDKKYGWK